MRLSGSYGIKAQPIYQADLQIQPTDFTYFEGWKIPINGPFTFVNAARGIVSLYTSCPGETPLYYVAQTQKIYWAEQKFQLPKNALKVKPGELIVWEPSYISNYFVDTFPKPNIQEDYPIEQAYTEYGNLLLSAIAKRLQTCPNPDRVAVAQSGGLDSLLITWALHTLGVEVVPLTICTSPQDLDITAAKACLEQWGLKPIPIAVAQGELEELTFESMRCLEDTETSNLRMGMGNILMARACQSLGITAIFTGHGHDDIHGKGTLVKSTFAKAKGDTDSVRWANTRAGVTLATGGMLKMFASTFRSYGVNVRMPYYDRELLTWAFNQPTSIIPVTFDKSFVRSFAQIVLPQGEWLHKKHSVGYLKGAGLSLKQDLLYHHPLYTPQSISQLFQKIKHDQHSTSTFK